MINSALRASNASSCAAVFVIDNRRSFAWSRWMLYCSVMVKSCFENCGRHIFASPREVLTSIKSRSPNKLRTSRTERVSRSTRPRRVQILVVFCICSENWTHNNTSQSIAISIVNQRCAKELERNLIKQKDEGLSMITFLRACLAD